ncbi:MAG: hypothetical protein GF372_12110 [Candidatus Marinimicrobia bacterium]|nr:hypothetical protein [Candidatus Neomarinimicrobiota bacterium]
MPRRNVKLHQMIMEVRTMATNAKNDAEILTRLEPRGWGEDRLNAMLTLAKQAEDAQANQDARYAHQKDITESLNKMRDELLKKHLDIRAYAKDALEKTDPDYTSLGLSQEPERKYASVISSVRKFCQVALSQQSLLTKLQQAANITEAELREHLDMISQMEDLFTRQSEAISDAQQSSEDKDGVGTKLKKDRMSMRKISRRVLRDKPQLLEKLGIIAKS